MAIKILITGGTFDKEYDELNGQLFFKDTHVNEILKLGRCNLSIQTRTLMMIDSLEMSDADRDIIINHCRQCDEDKIVITHGTDTMEHTARKIGEANLGKTIVITGAMIPYKFGSSDGLFNLGAALAFVQTLPTGVYVVMNGKYFPYNNVTKNKASGTFEELKN
ncbi:MAG: asparaginase [Chitinophagales bacterium]|jgi:L-asparaginase|nr:asparaginase [Chitinophagales bacterium]